MLCSWIKIIKIFNLVVFLDIKEFEKGIRKIYVYSSFEKLFKKSFNKGYKILL